MKKTAVRENDAAERCVQGTPLSISDSDLFHPGGPTYLIEFGGMERWRLSGDRASRDLIGDLAGTLELERARNGGPKRLHFIMTRHRRFGTEPTRATPQTAIGSRLGGLGWSLFSLELVRFWIHPLRHRVLCELADSCHGDLRRIVMLQALYPLYQAVIEAGGLFLHAAAMRIAGKAFIVVGPGGIGKTTLCNRAPRSWTVMSDDQAVAVPDRTHGYLVHPFPNLTAPLTGREPIATSSQNSFPLVGIFFLERAETDDVIPIGAGECASRLNMSALEASHVLWHRQTDPVKAALRHKMFCNASGIARKPPAAFRLRATLGGSFRAGVEEQLALWDRSQEW